MNEFEFKPCPFCGSTNIEEGESLSFDLEKTHHSAAACNDCGATGPHAIAIKLDTRTQRFDHSLSNKAWNNRTLHPKQTNFDCDTRSNIPHSSHNLKFSVDSSIYDEYCTKCGETDSLGSWGDLVFSCKGSRK